MNIETRFEPGDDVLILKGTKLERRVVHSVKIEVAEKHKIEISYFFRTEEKNGSVKWEIADQTCVFANKEEFLKQLEEVLK